MERVPQKVLNWLHSVLIGEYFDVNRTFSDVAQSLEAYNSLRPSTEVYTFENGSSALLLHITGTLPVTFRGGRYSFPVSLWIPKSYPNEAPIAFVTPTQEMAIRPGQHVSGEGRLFHPYLAHWQPQSQLLQLLKVMQDVFSREPPVMTKQAGPPRSATHAAPGAPPRPPLPNELRRDTTASPLANGPPQLPPKPFEQRPPSNNQPVVPPRPDLSPPPARPLPNGYQQVAPLQQWQQPPSQPSAHPRPAVQTHTPQQQNLPGPSPSSPQLQRQSQYPQHNPIGPPYGQFQQSQAPPPFQHTAQVQHQVSQPTQQKPPAMDLLTSPFDLPLPTQPTNLPPPPIPRNPEKDAILSAISQQLTTQLQTSVQANINALRPLAAQHAAMTQAMHNLQSEKGALLQLQSLLESDEHILHQAMHDADECIGSARHKSVPAVDEVLVAPSVVGQQLYTLVAEEKACIETRDVLGRALDRGRISSENWVKTVRSLAREEFLKKVLIKRCAEGMGLQTVTNL